MESSTPPEPSRRRLITAELAVVLLCTYVPMVFGQLFAQTPIRLTPTYAVYSMLARLGAIALCLYVVFAADRTLAIYGHKRFRQVDIGLSLLGLLATATITAVAYQSLRWVPEGPITNQQSVEAIRTMFTGSPFGILVVEMAVTNMFEEVLARGYLIPRLAELTGSAWTALILSSLAFGSYHLYQGYASAISATILGFAYGGYFLWTRRLWPIIGAHFLYDFFILYGYHRMYG